MTIDEINTCALEIRNRLKREQDDATNPIDITLNTVPPFIGGSDIRLIVVGQDPTIRNQARRSHIHTTLHLDQEGSLRRYLSQICPIAHIYATNLFKYFYTIPPADTLDVLQRHLAPNIQLLIEELVAYPNAPIITLGKPVLGLLATAGSREVKDYWGYTVETGAINGSFSHCLSGNSKLNRVFYPFPHQPSLRKPFYRDTLERYFTYFRIETYL